MIGKLVELGKSKMSGQSHALAEIEYAIELIIDKDGSFIEWRYVEGGATTGEKILNKKGKGRLLIDKSEEVLGFEESKHRNYLEKLDLYKDIEELAPVFKFYYDNKNNGLDRAIEEYYRFAAKDSSEELKNLLGNLNGKKLSITEVASELKKIVRKEILNKNILFLLSDNNNYYHINMFPAVLDAIKNKYEVSSLSAKIDRVCSLCGTDKYPVVEQPHGSVKFPGAQVAGAVLISYNNSSFESYGFKKNLNSSICQNCAALYIKGLESLLNEKTELKNESQKILEYKNRIKLSNNTLLLFWRKNGDVVSEVDFLKINQDVDPIKELILISQTNLKSDISDNDFKSSIDSVYKGQPKIDNIDSDMFYSCIISGVSARLFVRSWIEISVSQLRRNLIDWFSKIKIYVSDYTDKTYKLFYPSVNDLTISCCRAVKAATGKITYDDDSISSISSILWQCALQGHKPPLFLLSSVLQRIKIEQGNVTKSRASLIKYILNSFSKGEVMKENCDYGNENVSYLFGRAFAVLESIQYSALGDNINSSIKDRFFSAACTSPSITFARLIKLSNHHLAKIRGEKPGLEISLDKDLSKICSKIVNLPSIFTLEEQGQFALGYFHQRVDTFKKTEESKKNKEIDSE